MATIHQAIDKDALLNRCMGAEDFAASIVNQFLENWERDSIKLENCVAEALQSKSATNLIREAHRMKGTAATIAADNLADQFREIETLSRDAIDSCDYEKKIRDCLEGLQAEIDSIANFAATNL